MVIEPLSVYFMALVTRLVMTCTIRLRSRLSVHLGKPNSHRIVTGLSGSRRRRSDSSVSFIKAFTSKSLSIYSMLPASIFDMSRMSFMSCNNCPLFDWIIREYSSCSSFVSAPHNSSENPTMALSGVRISWLMLARNADLRLFSSSAFFLASVSTFSICLRLVTSCIEPSSVFRRPFASRSPGTTRTSYHSVCLPLPRSSLHSMSYFTLSIEPFIKSSSKWRNSSRDSCGNFAKVSSPSVVTYFKA